MGLGPTSSIESLKRMVSRKMQEIPIAPENLLRKEAQKLLSTVKYVKPHDVWIMQGKKSTKFLTNRLGADQLTCQGQIHSKAKAFWSP